MSDAKLQAWREQEERREEFRRLALGWTRDGLRQSTMTREQQQAVKCPTCGVEPGQPCDRSYHKLFLLAIFVRGVCVHTARYQRAVTAIA